jgi:hypothetical protein
MEMKIHHCMNSEENPLPVWMTAGKSAPEEKKPDLVSQFKNNPDSFFPDFYHAKKPQKK